jgi:small subunit ribosomal protein S19
MSRSIWKNPFSESIIFKNIYINNKDQKPFLILSRNSTIFPIFVGNIFSIYNGKKFVNLQIQDNMVGYKFGEFVATRKKAVHKKK